MENKILPYLIAICALLVSGSAAFYSVYGLGKMFAGASIQVMVLAGSLEVSKLVIASFLYRYWPRISATLRYYLAFATFLLVLITSGGIYGFLSSAYQETATKMQINEGEVKLLVSKKESVSGEITALEKEISDLANIRNAQQNKIATTDLSNTKMQNLNRFSTQRETEMKTLKIRKDSLLSQKNSLEETIIKKENNTELAGDIGPLKYLAGITGRSIDEIVNWFIIALMLVFDPLALALVISANMAFAINKKISDEEKEKNSVAALKTEEKAEPVLNEETSIEPQTPMQEEEVEEKEEAVQEDLVEIEEHVDPVENLNQIIEEHLNGVVQDDLKKNLSVEVKEPEKITGETINTLNQQVDPTRIR
jgi:hypothetical protein